jgi:hypothetical protein
MTFDIHQQIFDEDGLTLEQKAREYQDQLLELYWQSPELEELRNEGHSGRWARNMLELGIEQIGITPPQMSADDMREILFELIPRKISALAKQAPEVIRELQVFWKFLQREFQLENAEACLSVLNDEGAVDTLREEMSNPDNFGMAKSFVMMGLERGFNMQSQEGLDEWMRTYNAELLAGKIAPPKLPRELIEMQKAASLLQRLGAPDEDYEDFVDADDLENLTSSTPTRRAPSRSSRQSHNKQKLKMAKASRKKNRKRK